METKASDLASDFQDESRKRFKAALERLVQATGGGDVTDLAHFLGISRQAINSATAKNKIPPAWFVSVGEKANISIDWLVTGKGPMRPGEATVAPAEIPLEPARAGVMRAGDRLATPVVQADASALNAQAGEMNALRMENRELRQENRELRLENRELLKENADLRVAMAEIRARAAPERDASKEMPEEEARKSA